MGSLQGQVREFGLHFESNGDLSACGVGVVIQW